MMAIYTYRERDIYMHTYILTNKHAEMHIDSTYMHT